MYVTISGVRLGEQRGERNAERDAESTDVRLTRSPSTWLDPSAPGSTPARSHGTVGTRGLRRNGPPGRVPGHGERLRIKNVVDPRRRHGGGTHRAAPSDRAPFISVPAPRTVPSDLVGDGLDQAAQLLSRRLPSQLGGQLPDPRPLGQTAQEAATSGRRLRHALDACRRVVIHDLGWRRVPYSDGAVGRCPPLLERRPTTPLRAPLPRSSVATSYPRSAAPQA